MICRMPMTASDRARRKADACPRAAAGWLTRYYPKMTDISGLSDQCMQGAEKGANDCCRSGLVWVKFLRPAAPAGPVSIFHCRA